MTKKQENYIICKKCGKTFRVNTYRLKAVNPKYCSSKCYHQDCVGKPQSKITIARRVAKTTGKKRTKELKQRMSKILKGVYVGKLASGYIDGRTKDPKHLRQRNQKYHARRRIRDTFAGELSAKTVQRVYEDNIKKYGTLTCHYCKELIAFGKDQLEHKTPVCRGGTNIYSNLTIACKRCNCTKNTKTEEEFFQYLVENK